MNVIDKIQKDQMDKIVAERSIPDFSAGDTIKVDVKIVEGDKERIQAFGRPLKSKSRAFP